LHFADREVPSFGRYARRPAVADERGLVSVPPDPLPKIVAGAVIAAGLAYGLSRTRRAHGT
jgi:hypothetical protein